MSENFLQKIFLSKILADITPEDPLVTVDIKDTLGDTVTAMSDKHIGSAIVTENDELVGIFTERDLIKKVACLQLPSKDIPIVDVMTKDPRTISARASVARAIFALASGGYRHLPFTDKDTKTLRVLSIKDIIIYIHNNITKEIVQPDSTLMPGDNSTDTFFFEDLSILEPRDPLLVKETDTLAEGMKQLCSGSGGCVLVTDEDGKLSGIFTERDYLKKVVLSELDMDQTRMAQVMTASPKTLNTTSSVALGLNILAEGHFRHLPIMSPIEELVGFLSAKNFFSFLAERIIKDLSDEHTE